VSRAANARNEDHVRRQIQRAQAKEQSHVQLGSQRPLHEDEQLGARDTK
jgi:hypothetical protein